MVEMISQNVVSEATITPVKAIKRVIRTICILGSVLKIIFF